MAQYQVGWTVPVEADSPEDAVQGFFDMLEEEAPPTTLTFVVKDTETLETTVLVADGESLVQFFDDEDVELELKVVNSSTILL